jgi:hypothetical protein
MGEIKISIPRDLESAFEEAFPGEDKAAAVLQLVESEIARRRSTDAVVEREFQELVDEVLRLRQEPPYFTDEDIRKVREELRQ